MAINNVKLSPADMMRDCSCAVGVSLTPKNAPKTAALVRGAAFNTARGTGSVKDFYKRERPFHYDAGATCRPRSKLAESYDYVRGKPDCLRHL